MNFRCGSESDPGSSPACRRCRRVRRESESESDCGSSWLVRVRVGLRFKLAGSTLMVPAASAAGPAPLTHWHLRLPHKLPAVGWRRVRTARNTGIMADDSDPGSVTWLGHVGLRRPNGDGRASLCQTRSCSRTRPRYRKHIFAMSDIANTE
jgi:hypothetical protein